MVQEPRAKVIAEVTGATGPLRAEVVELPKQGSRGYLVLVVAEVRG